MRTVSFTGNKSEEGLAKKIAAFLEETDKANGTSTMVDMHFDQMAVVLDANDDVVGVFASRPVVLLHEFRIKGGFNQRIIAESMMNYAMGAGAASGHIQAIMAIDKTNAPMLRFVRDKKAKLYSDGEDTIFLLNIE